MSTARYDGIAALAWLLNAFTGAGLRLERALESPGDPPGMLALAAVRER